MVNLHQEDFLTLALQRRFCIECVNFWCEYNYNENVNTVTEMSEQPLCYHSLIKVKNKTVFFKLVFDSAIRTVSNIIDNNVRMLSYEALCE